MASPNDDPFEELRAASEELRRHAGGLRAAIEKAEGRLRENAPAIEAWLTDHPFFRQDLSVSQSPVAAHIESHLGWAPDPRPGRLAWCLCLRTAEFAERALEDGRALVRVHQCRRLLDAGEDEQLTALPRIPDLVRAIAAATRDRTKAIERAGEE